MCLFLIHEYLTVNEQDYAEFILATVKEQQLAQRMCLFS